MELAVVIVIGIVLVIAFMQVESARANKATTKYAADPSLQAAILKKTIWIGMPEDQLVDSWGRPSKRTVRHLKTKVKVTLYFGTSRRVYLDNGRVTGWHQKAPAQRSYIFENSTAIQRRRR